MRRYSLEPNTFDLHHSAHGRGLLGTMDVEGRAGARTEFSVDVDPQNWFHEFGNGLSARMRDFLDLIAVVMAADRLGERHHDQNGYRWSREFIIPLPVRDLDFWRDTRVKSNVKDLLTFLTNDTWNFEWRQISRPTTVLASHTTNLPFDSDRTGWEFSLLSGGLDSAAGACGLLQQVCGGGKRLGLVTVSTKGPGVAVQNQVFSVFQRSYGDRVVPIRLPVQFSGPEDAKPMRRSRMFVFAGLGAIAARVLGGDRLHLCENGLAALCLPPVPVAFRWQTARGVHARFLTQMSHLLSLVFEDDFRLVNPFLLSTKAQMCSHIKQSGLERVIRASVSCDRFPRREAGSRMCGVCSPCCVRRQSIAAAGLELFDPLNRYMYDVTNAETSMPQWETKLLTGFRMKLQQITDCVGANESWMSLIRLYPDLETTKRDTARAMGMRELDAQRAILQMLSTFVYEWEMFPMPTHYSAKAKVPALQPSASSGHISLYPQN